MASAACMYSSVGRVGGVHCIIMLEGKKERSLVNIKGQVQHWPNTLLHITYTNGTLPFFSELGHMKLKVFIFIQFGISLIKRHTVLLALTSSVGVLKERKKERKKETPVKLKRQCFALA